MTASGFYMGISYYFLRNEDCHTEGLAHSSVYKLFVVKPLTNSYSRFRTAVLRTCSRVGKWPEKEQKQLPGVNQALWPEPGSSYPHK